MRIGFRFDEYDRMERFFNNSNPCNFSIPVSCSTKGQRRQHHEEFNWRFCSFPLIKNGIIKSDVIKFWKTKGYVGGNLFEQRRLIDWPVISNCVGCFHKKQETLAAMAYLNPEKMNWFAEQEEKNKGKWLDSLVSYSDIILNKKDLVNEALAEILYAGESCDSGGCTD